MGGLLSFLVVVCFVLLVIGMFKPSAVLRGTGGTRGKVGLVYGLGFLGLSMVNGMIHPPPDKPNRSSDAVTETVHEPALPPEQESAVAEAPLPPSEPATPTALEQTLGLTPQDFQQRFDDIIGTVKRSYKLEEFSVHSWTSRDTFTAKFGSNISFVGSISKQSGQIIHVAITATGEYEDLDLVRTVAVAAFQAVNSDDKKEYVANTVSHLIRIAARNIGTNAAPKKISVGQVEYTAYARDHSNLTLSARMAD